MNADFQPQHGAPGTDPASDVPQEPDVSEERPDIMSAAQKNYRPKSILELFRFAYAMSGRRLGLTPRDFSEFHVDKAAAQEEIDTVKQLAITDRFLAVPPVLLASIAEHDVNGNVVRRVLELVRVALAGHSLFQPHAVRLFEVQTAPDLVKEISDAARKTDFDALGLQKTSELNGTGRERLRVNAVTTYGLLRMLSGQCTLDQYVEDMNTWVWRAQHRRSDLRTAALLATAKNSDALGELSRHMGGLIKTVKREAEDLRAQAAYQQRLVEQERAIGNGLAVDLASTRAEAAALALRVEEMSRLLSEEQSNRVVDKSHLVDDYESLRTRVIRRLTGQVELLDDGLHALRRGSTNVAEEFVDRALSAINAEVNRLKNTDGDVK